MAVLISVPVRKSKINLIRKLVGDVDTEINRESIKIYFVVL